MERIKMVDQKLETQMTATKPKTKHSTRETMVETKDMKAGMVTEIVQEAGERIETLADITKIIAIITTTHKDEIQSNNIKETESPSTDCLRWTGGSTGTAYRTSTDTGLTTVNSTDTGIKNRWTERHIQIGITGTVLSRIFIQGIKT